MSRGPDVHADTPLRPIVLGLLGYTVLGLLFAWAAVSKKKTWTLKALMPEIES